MRGTDRKDIPLFFLSFLFQAFGYEFVFFIMTVHVYGMTKSALGTGLFTALTFAPRLFSPFLGGLADRLGRGRCLSFSAAAVAVLLPVLLSAADPRALYAAWFLTSVFLTFIVNARGAMMADIVSPARYAAGNALTLSVLNGARILGPLAGGFVAALHGTRPLIIITCILYASASVTAAFIRGSGKPVSGRARYTETVGKGFAAITENRALGTLASVAFLWRLFLGLQVPLFVVFIESRFGGAGGRYGFFMAAAAVGSILGSLAGSAVAKHIDPARLSAAGLGFHYASFAALGFLRDYRMAVGLVIASFLVFYATLVGLHSARDRFAPAEIRGSLYGTVTALLTPAAILSMLTGGFLADRFGAGPVLSGAGFLALASLFPVLHAGGSGPKRGIRRVRVSGEI